MTPLERVIYSIESAEACLMGDYSPPAQLAKGHLHIARLAVMEEIKQRNGSERPEPSTATVYS